MMNSLLRFFSWIHGLHRPRPTPPSPAPRPTPQAEGLLGLVNAERAKVGAPALSEDPRLTRAASGHAIDMAAHEFLSHTGSDGSDFEYRAEAAGYPLKAGGEVVAMDEGDAASTLTVWMDSPPHHAILMSPAYSHAGFGVGVAPDGREYWCGVLAA